MNEMVLVEVYKHKKVKNRLLYLRVKYFNFKLSFVTWFVRNRQSFPSFGTARF